MTPKKPRKSKKLLTLSDLLKLLEADVLKRAEYDLIGEGPYQGVLKSSFIKAFEFACYCNRIDPEKVDEASSSHPLCAASART